MNIEALSLNVEILKSLFEKAYSEDRSSLIGIRNKDIVETDIQDSKKRTWNVRQETENGSVTTVTLELVYVDYDDESFTSHNVNTGLKLTITVPNNMWTKLFDGWLHM